MILVKIFEADATEVGAAVFFIKTKTLVLQNYQNKGTSIYQLPFADRPYEDSIKRFLMKSGYSDSDIRIIS
jgi:hypothetical protein